MSIRLAADLKSDLELAAAKLKMDTHQVMRLAMEVGLEHFTRIDHNLASCIVDRIAREAVEKQSHNATVNHEHTNQHLCPTILADSAASTTTTRTKTPVQATASFVTLPPPPVLATAGHWSLNENSETQPVTESRAEAQYAKKRRKA